MKWLSFMAVFRRRWTVSICQLFYSLKRVRRDPHPLASLVFLPLLSTESARFPLCCWSCKLL